MATRGNKGGREALIDRKIAPKLRLFANGDEQVCQARAEFSPALAVSAPRQDRLRQARTVLLEEPAERKRHDKPKLKKVVSSARASVFVHFSSESPFKRSKKAFEGMISHRGNIAMAEVPLDKLASLSQRGDVTLVEPGDSVRVPPVLVSSEPDATSAPSPTERKVSALAATHKFGENILVGIIDVSGIAFAHPDFLDGDKTRIVRLWDMGGNFRPPPSAANPGRGFETFDYGAEFRREHFNDAIAQARRIGVSPYAIERQSQQSTGSHGTHVASIAAGNSGVCRRADIAGVMLALDEDEDLDRRRSFYDSTRIAQAVEYLLTVADQLGRERGLNGPMPVSINISLGPNGHAHDGSAAVNRWIDHALVKPGRAVCVAAGNAGQEAPAFTGDIGFVMGRIHSSGRIAASRLSVTMDWIVVGNGTADLSENEMEIWYEPQDRMAVTLISPAPGSQRIGPVKPGEFVENRQLSDGTFVSIYNELYSPANGANYISIYLTPRLKRPFIGVKSGEWRVVLEGMDIRDGRFHAWLERDDPRPIERRNQVNFMAVPSFFSARSNVDRNSVSTLGCGERILSVGNYDSVRRRANISSSQGPTRDDRSKPEVLGPGTHIVAANGFAGPDDAWIGMTGTSMASPYVCGVAGLMFAIQPDLTAAQVIGIMRRTARPMDDGDFAWKDDVGFGLIDPDACLREAAAINNRKDLG
jgi:subtilisin family serine protease